MSISVTDINGNPLKYISVFIAKGSAPDDRRDDRFTDLAGHTSWPGGWVGGERWGPATGGVDLYVNDRNVQPQYASHHLHVADLEAQEIRIVLEATGGGGGGGAVCPANFDKAQFRAWFDRVKVGSTVTQANMEAMAPALRACGFEWQNMCRNPSEWRPRIHQPPFLNGPCSGSTHDVDCGDFGGPWLLTFRY